MKDKRPMHKEIRIAVEVQGKKCTVNASAGGDNMEFWLDFSLQDIQVEKLPYYTTEICASWLIATLKRDGVKSVNIHCSHAPRKNVIQCWCLLSQIRLTDLAFEHDSVDLDSASKNVESSVCVSWGGGKDSYAALDIVSKVMTGKKRYIFDFSVHKDGKKLEKRMDRRREFSIIPTEEKFQAKCITVTSNAPGQMKLPNSAKYFSFLPFLISEYGIDFFCYSFESMFFYDGTEKTGDTSGIRFPVRREQPYDMSRSLAAKLISNMMGRISGREFHLFNANYQFTEYSAFIYVAKFCEEGLDRIMMCESVVDKNTKWCGRCTKCAQLVLYSLSQDLHQEQIDPNEFLEKSSWTMNALEGGPEWYKGLTHPGHIDSFRFVLHRIPDVAIQKLSEGAQENLKRIIKNYSSDQIFEEDGIFVKNLFASWPNEYAYTAYKYLASLFPVYEAPKFTRHRGNMTVIRSEELQSTTRAIQIIDFLLDGER